MVNYDNWRHRAACRDEDPELFFPVSDVGLGARQAEQAKQVCAGCPVRVQCLEYALDNGLNHGVYGGTTETDRRKLRHRRRTDRPAA